MVVLAEIPEGGLRLNHPYASEAYDLGAGTPWKITRYVGLTGIPIRSGSTDLPRGHGAHGGPHFAGPRLINVSLETVASSPADVEAALADLRRYCVPIETPDTGNLVYWRPIGETHARRRSAFARPLRCDLEYRRPVTRAEGDITIECRDARWRFDLQDHDLLALNNSVDVSQDPAGTFPSTVDLTVTASAGIIHNITVTATHPTFPTVVNEFTGVDLAGATGDQALLRFNRIQSPDGTSPIGLIKGGVLLDGFATWTTRAPFTIPPGDDDTTVQVDVTTSGGGAGTWRLRFNSTEM